MFGWLNRLMDWHVVRSFKKAFWFSERRHSRFPDGRRYYATWDGAVGLDLNDPQTRKVIADKMKEIDEGMRKSQPHMYDKDGNFIGGVLKGHH